MSVIEKPNVVDLCRLCLTRDETLIPVFDSFQISQILCDKIKECLAVKISTQDRVSQQICGSCLIKVDTFYEFKSVTSEAQRVLEGWLHDLDSALIDINSKAPEVHSEKVTDGDCSLENSSEDDGSEKESESSEEASSCGESEQFVAEQRAEQIQNDVINVILPVAESAGPSGLQSSDAFLEERRSHTSNENGEKRMSDFVCKHCNIELKNSASLKKHMKETHSTFVCYCGAKFMSLKYLNRHEARHNAKPTIPCKLCNKLFITASELKDHEKSHQLGEKISCHLCDYVSLYKSNMSRHLKRHNKEYTVFCESCNEGFFSKDELDSHQIKSHGAAPYFCLLCRKSFTNKSYLHEHNKITHWTKTKDFLCETCGKAFKTKNATKRHMKLHLGLKYICHICNKCVNTPYSLKKHIKAHMGEKNVVCYICGKAFVDNKYMAAHLRSHTGERPYACKECGKRFTQATSLKVHLRYHSGERPYACSFCGLGFVTNSLLTNHIKSHIPTSISNGMKH